MSCGERTELSARIDGELPAARRAALDRHLEDCGSCRGELASLRATAAHLRGLPDPVPPAPIAPRVLARLEEGGATSRWERIRDLLLTPHPVHRPLAVGVLVLAAALGVRSLAPASDPALTAEERLRELDLQLGPLVGASEGAEPAPPANLEALDPVLDRLRADPDAFARDWAALAPALRERLEPLMATRARQRGDERELAALLRGTGVAGVAPLADHLAR